MRVACVSHITGLRGCNQVPEFPKSGQGQKELTGKGRLNVAGILECGQWLLGDRRGDTPSLRAVLVWGWVSARLFPYRGIGEAEAAPGMV